MSCPISNSEVERFSRQMVLTGWGGREQSKLKALTVAIEGRYISAAVYLAAAGVGELVLIDPALKPTDPLVTHISELNPETKVGVVKSTAALPASGQLIVIGTDLLTGPFAVSSADSITDDDRAGLNAPTHRGIRIEPGTKSGSIKLIPVWGSTNGSSPKGKEVELTFPSLLSSDLFAGAAAASAVIETVLRPSK